MRVGTGSKHLWKRVKSNRQDSRAEPQIHGTTLVPAARVTARHRARHRADASPVTTVGFLQPSALSGQSPRARVAGPSRHRLARTPISRHRRPQHQRSARSVPAAAIIAST